MVQLFLMDLNWLRPENQSVYDPQKWLTRASADQQSPPDSRGIQSHFFFTLSPKSLTQYHSDLVHQYCLLKEP